MDMLQLATVCYFLPDAHEFRPKASPISACQSMNGISDLGLYLMTTRSPMVTILPQQGLLHLFEKRTPMSGNYPHLRRDHSENTQTREVRILICGLYFRI